MSQSCLSLPYLFSLVMWNVLKQSLVRGIFFPQKRIKIGEFILIWEILDFKRQQRKNQGT